MHTDIQTGNLDLALALCSYANRHPTPVDELASGVNSLEHKYGANLTLCLAIDPGRNAERTYPSRSTSALERP